MVNGQKEYIAFYPLQPNRVEFLSFENDKETYIKLCFASGEQTTMRYKDIIHLRDDFTYNGLLGGDINGQVETRELLKTVSVLDKVVDLLPKAITASLSIRGIISAKSTIGGEKLEKEREKFEQQINDSKAGVVAVGLDTEFQPMNINPSLIPKDTLEWIEHKILRTYGVSMAIISGDFTEAQSSAFFQKCIEDFLTQAEQAFTPCLYTKQQIEKGHKVKIYDRLIQHLSMETRLKILERAAPIGALQRDEIRELIGYEPIGDNTFMQSLNWIDSKLASAYQLQGGKGDKEGKET